MTGYRLAKDLHRPLIQQRSNKEINKKLDTYNTNNPIKTGKQT